jgi:hypothetical protein
MHAPRFLCGRLHAKLVVRRAKYNSKVIYLDPCNEPLRRMNRESEASDNADVSRLFLAESFGMMDGKDIREHAKASLKVERR